MNFIFISPHFPHTYWEFCRRLKQSGVNVLGIADVPYDSLNPQLIDSLTEYYKVGSLESYDDVYRAVAFFSFKYGHIDWIESNNEYWLEQDARLRTDFNVTTGIRIDRIAAIKEKSEMKKIYGKAGIPTARQIKASEDLSRILSFAATAGYPLVAKPDIGVGAGGTSKIHDEGELLDFIRRKGNDPADYVIEEFISGDICSYDAIIDSRSHPLFESMTVWPPSIMDIVNKQLDLSYYVSPVIPDSLRTLGRKTVEAFDVRSRFVHLEFFRLDRDRIGLGNKGDFVALEVNMRPAGGYTPDMINFAHATDVYRIWADMVIYDSYRPMDNDPEHAVDDEYYCAFASRRDIHNYEYSDEEVKERYGRQMVMCERMPEILAGAMGQQMFTVRMKTLAEVEEFVNYVHKKRN